MSERICVENCLQVSQTLCNGCPVVEEAQELLIRRQFEPIADTLREVGSSCCPEGRRPEFRVEGNLIPPDRRQIIRIDSPLRADVEILELLEAAG